MFSIEVEKQNYNTFMADLQQKLKQQVVQEIEDRLEAEVSQWLQREQHERRAGLGRRQSNAQCQKCGSRRIQDFSRNGHRRRQMVTTLGVLTYWLPRVVCQCGGSVHLPFSILKPYQRWWDDVVGQVNRWADWGVSLRQMQTAIGEQIKTQVGLRKLNTIVQTTTPVPEQKLSSVPPIVMLDAIWVTLLEDTEMVQIDSRGRQRGVKSGKKVCLLVALGLYPQSGRWGILGWSLADSEDQPAWEQLLLPLEQRGLFRERGLELFIHDGSKGLIAALNYLYPHVPHQRCWFHKLRNLRQAIQVPPEISSPEWRTFKSAIIQQIRPLVALPTAQAALLLRDDFCAQYQASQPKLVATLLRDWQDTIAFYRVLARFPDWPRKYLRTTSLLERVNRMIRRLFRTGGAFHSPDGLLAAAFKVLAPKLLS